MKFCNEYFLEFFFFSFLLEFPVVKFYQEAANFEDLVTVEYVIE